MARGINKLTARAVSTKKEPGWYSDGNGLYLQVSPSGSKSFVYRYKVDGKERRMGLGSVSPENSLEAARRAAEQARQLKAKGIDPIEHKRSQEAERALQVAKTITFKEFALKYIDLHKSGWKNPRHESYWRNTLQKYAFPVIGDLPVQHIDTGLVLEVIEPIWLEKTETASRVRQRIENILDWAKARGFREGENPARWKGHLDRSLPKRQKVQKTKHFSAMPYQDVPAFYQAVRAIDTIAAKALAFTILTACRGTEAREVVWSEIDGDMMVLPPLRMKADREHRIPLTAEAMAIIEEVKGYDEKFLFPGHKRGKAISEVSVRHVLRKTHPQFTIHGFRSSFRDWCAETTSYPLEVVEKCLAHGIKDATEASYQRGDMLAKRAKLMQAWAVYCTDSSKQAEVIPIKKNSQI